MQLPIEQIEWLDETPDDKDKEIERLKGWLLLIRDENPPVEGYAQLKIMASNALEPYGI